MIFKHFLKHQLKESLRSTIWQKQLVLNIIIGIFMLIMMAYLVFLGLFIDKILVEISPDSDPIILFNSMILYYLGVELLIRFFMQSLPVLNIESYLQLPIKKSSIVHYVAGKSIFSIGNYLSWLIFIPFGIKVIAPAFGVGPAIVWILSMIMLIYSNNFLATYIKRQLVHKPQIVGLFALGLAGIFLLQKLDIFSLSEISSYFLGRIIDTPDWISIPFALLALSYILNYSFLKSRLYPDEIIHKKKNRTDQLGEIGYLKKIGLTGELISLELRLIWRHKRTRSIFFMAPIFLLYGLIFYQDETYTMGSGFLIFVGIFMTGGMMLNYANYCFGYDSNYFDSILIHYSDFKQYIRVKYIVAVSITTICYILTIPYALYGDYIFLINTAAFLYNVGFLSFGLFYTATYSTNRLDLSKNASFNYQGMGATHWLSMLPAFLLPVLIIWPFKHFEIAYIGYIVVGLLGLIGIMLHKTLLGVLTRQFMKRRHIMAKGFRS